MFLLSTAQTSLWALGNVHSTPGARVSPLERPRALVTPPLLFSEVYPSALTSAGCHLSLITGSRTVPDTQGKRFDE